MKTTKLFLSLIVICLLFADCTYEENTFLIDDQTQNQQQFNQKQFSISAPIKSKNVLIIEYAKSTGENAKSYLRDKYDIVKYETCDCSNKRIEKWEFPFGTEIEGRKEDLAQEGGVEGTEYQLFYQNGNTTLSNNNIAQNISLISSYIKPINSDATIAILDTGIDINKLQVKDPFLYNNSNNTSLCNDELNPEIIGWDFVNHDNNPFDDNGHGTIVTDILKSKLDNDGFSDYQILPIKVFNDLGKGNTFDILCGYLYAADKPEVALINMSFGWYYYPSPLLSKFIGENQHILHITSAGNHNVNNDTTKHFPSSIPHRNVLAVGSYGIKQVNNDQKVFKSDFSNYGFTSVDFLSKGENISFYNPETNDYITVNGTSYAAPRVTAIAMEYFSEGYEFPNQMIQQLYLHATLLEDANELPVKFFDRFIQ